MSPKPVCQCGLPHRAATQVEHVNEEIITSVTEGIGLQTLSRSRIADGATGIAWLIRAASASYVLRVASPKVGKTACFEADAAVRQELRKIDSRVAEPIATNVSHPVEGLSIDWIIDEYIEGEMGRRGLLPAKVCRDLGEVLAALHTVPCNGNGLLLNSRGQIEGAEHDAESGIASRYQDPWPFDGGSLRNHPIASGAPDLLKRLNGRRHSLLQRLKNTNVAVVHTDLHEGQMICSEGGTFGADRFWRCHGRLAHLGLRFLCLPSWVGSGASAARGLLKRPRFAKRDRRGSKGSGYYSRPPPF